MSIIRWWIWLFVCFLSCGHTEKAQRGVPRIDRYRRPGSSSPGLFPLHIYKAGKIIPTVATSQVIIDIEAGLMITQTNVSSLYDDVLVCSKHISGPWGMQGPFGLKWSLNEPVFWVQ